MESNNKQINIVSEEKLFIDINPDNPITEIESYCVNCEDNGITRILLTKIPFFKEIIIMAFSCPHCGYRSSEVQPGQVLSDHGIHLELTIVNEKDLNRRVIKSEYATIKVPECNLEIPPNTQKGKLTTVEGFLTVTRDEVQQALKDGVYDEMEDEAIDKIKAFINKLDAVVNLKDLPAKFIIDDPAGNSFIENPFAPHTDPYINVAYYERTEQMAESMGYQIQPKDNNENTKEEKIQDKREFVAPTYYNKTKDFTIYKSTSSISAHLLDFTKSIETNNNIKEEALRFETSCYCCGFSGANYMCVCSIPFFKEIIITCFKCENCGYKTAEVKGGGGMSDRATKFTLDVQNAEDLNRDVFKSETAKIIIPELGFETDSGSMGSMYTTVEGVMEKLIDSLDSIPFTKGDSSENDDCIDNYVKKIRLWLTEKKPFTLIIDDPAANSFIQPLDEGGVDKRLKKEEYERSWQQNEDLGINDMKTENYTEQEKNI